MSMTNIGEMALDFDRLLREERSKALESSKSTSRCDSAAKEATQPPEEAEGDPPLRVQLSRRSVLDMDHFRVVTPTPEVFYIPDYVTADEADALLACARDERYQSRRWIDLRHRRVQNWGGNVTPSGLVGKEDLPLWLKTLAQSLVHSGIFQEAREPNHVLVNEYHRGEGAMLQRVWLLAIHCI